MYCIAYDYLSFFYLLPIIDLVAKFCQSVSFAVNNNNATIEILSGSNYKRWRSDIKFVLGMMDIVIYCDNNAVVFYSKNNKISTGSKHMEIKYLTVKDLVKKGDIVIEHIRTESMLANPVTKGLKPITFKEHVVNMGVIKSFDSLV